jgi:hypothetical protein
LASPDLWSEVCRKQIQERSKESGRTKYTIERTKTSRGGSFVIYKMNEPPYITVYLPKGDNPPEKIDVEVTPHLGE